MRQMAPSFENVPNEVLMFLFWWCFFLVSVFVAVTVDVFFVGPQKLHATVSRKIMEGTVGVTVEQVFDNFCDPTKWAEDHPVTRMAAVEVTGPTVRGMK